MRVPHLFNALRRVIRGNDLGQYPACPKAREGYVLFTANMVHFDLLDGDEECGGVECKATGESGDEQWAVHVYGVDLVFPSFRKARIWLNKPEIRFERIE